ncbi:MAG TPA: multiheme c-type cytochrome [Tepidisphaeraceae bacterium]|jgi:hypothetical protein|nr:multiheme c-type cytochrome [Tepidisphaeraceae bacterium]
MTCRSRNGGIGALAAVVLAMLACMTALIVWWHTRGATAQAAPTVVVSGDTAGWITSGCTPKQSGGLARRASYLADLREQGSVIYLDAGGAASGTSEYHRLKFEALVEGERSMQIAAHNLGKSELALGPHYLRQIASRMHFPFVSENTRDTSGKRIIENRRIVESGGLRVGVIGVVSPLYGTDQIIVDDPRQAVVDATIAMKGHCNSLIVLAYMPEDELRKLAADLPQVDAIVGGAGEETISPKAVGATTLAAAGEYGKHLVEMRVPPGRSQGAWEGKMVEMTSSIVDDATQINNLQRYLNMLEAKDFSASESGVVGMMAAAGEQGMAGSGSCLKCHASDYNSWIGSRHARAFASLQEMGFHVDSSCQKCHTSNFAMAGGFVSVRRSGASELAGVGCESCHGPSAAHVKDPKKHTPWAAIVQCVHCHNEDNCPHFDYATGWEKIRHGTPTGVKKN